MSVSRREILIAAAAAPAALFFSERTEASVNTLNIAAGKVYALDNVGNYLTRDIGIDRLIFYTDPENKKYTYIMIEPKAGVNARNSALSEGGAVLLPFNEEFDLGKAMAPKQELAQSKNESRQLTENEEASVAGWSGTFSGMSETLNPYKLRPNEGGSSVIAQEIPTTGEGMLHFTKGFYADKQTGPSEPALLKLKLLFS